MSTARQGEQQHSGAVKAGVLLAAAVLFAVTLELQIRLFLPEYDPAGQFRFRQASGDRPPLGIPGSVQRHMNKPGDYNVLVHFNSQGLRDRRSIATAEGEDIIALGDSFTMGFGVEEGERYSDHLERAISRPVYNLALPGVLADQVKLLRYARALGSGAKRVIIGIVLESAVRIYEPDELELLEREPPASRAEFELDGQDSSRRSWREFLNTHSAAYLALTTTLKRNPTINRLLERTGLASPSRPITGMYSDEEIKSATEYLQKMLRGYEPVVVVIPTKNAYSGPYQNGINSGIDRLVEALQSKFDTVIDLRSVYLAEGEPLRAYFASEGHWNSRGHAAAAAAIAARLPPAWQISRSR